MSLLAATLIASTAMAADETASTTEKGAEYAGISNIKVSGDAKLNYATWDGSNDEKLFDQPTAAGQVGASVGITADLTEGVSAGVTMNGLSSLGLENNLVGNVWEGTTANTAKGAVGPAAVAGLKDQFWFSNAWIAGTTGKTTGKIGRMELDTPLVFSETWSMYANTFEAAVLVNQDLPGTTLVGAYVGGSNGSEGGSIGDQNVAGTRENISYGGVLAGGQDNANSAFHSFYEGAYTIGAVNNSWEPLKVQAWYFQAQHLLNTYWLQADLSMMGLELGGQFVGLNESDSLTGRSTTAGAGKIGYTMKDTFSISGAFSKTGKRNTAIQVGGNLAASGQSKLYTEAWWNYGYITKAETTAVNITATTPEEITWVGLGAYITQATTKDEVTKNSAEVVDGTLLEVTLEATKKVGPVDISVYYILTDANTDNIKKGDDNDAGKSYNTVQAYLTYAF